MTKAAGDQRKCWKLGIIKICDTDILEWMIKKQMYIRANVQYTEILKDPLRAKLSPECCSDINKHKHS